MELKPVLLSSIEVKFSFNSCQKVMFSIYCIIPLLYITNDHVKRLDFYSMQSVWIM